MRVRLVVFLALLCALPAWGNPFITPSSASRPAPMAAAPISRLAAIQRQLNERLASLVGEARRPGATGARALLMGVAFAYGLIHALGPGHRKTVLVSYFLAEGARTGTGILAGAAMSGLHAASAVALVVVGYALVRGSVGLILEDAGLLMEILSYAAVAAVGTLMLALRIREIVKTRRGATSGESIEGKARPHRRSGGRGLPALVIASGIVPCPGAAMLLVLALSLGAVPLGILAVIAMSAGMAAALLVISVSTILLRDRVLRFSRGTGGATGVIHHILSIGGATAVAGFGVVMLVARL